MSSRNALFFSSRDVVWEVKAPLFEFRSSQGQRDERSPKVTILFISLSPAQSNLEADWAERARELFCADVPFACMIPSLVMVAGANRLMMNTKLDRDSPRPLESMRQDIHVPAAILAAL